MKRNQFYNWLRRVVSSVKFTLSYDITIAKAISIVGGIGLISFGGYISYISNNYEQRMSIDDFSRWEIWAIIGSFTLLMIGIGMWINKK